MKGQTDLFDEIIVDNFAGGGGASTGIELATGRPVAIADGRVRCPGESAGMVQTENHNHAAAGQPAVGIGR